jgi:hypothetical protein
MPEPEGLANTVTAIGARSGTTAANCIAAFIVILILFSSNALGLNDI